MPMSTFCNGISVETGICICNILSRSLYRSHVFFVFGLLSCLFLQVSSVRPTWFEDIAAPKDTTSQSNQDPQWQQSQPLHGLKLVIKEEVLPMKDQPEFPSLELLATRGLLAPDTWKCKRAQVSLKATIDVPMLGKIIEQNGNGLLEDSHMPVGWPLHIDGAVTQYSSICEPAETR